VQIHVLTADGQYIVAIYTRTDVSFIHVPFPQLAAISLLARH